MGSGGSKREELKQKKECSKVSGLRKNVVLSKSRRREHMAGDMKRDKESMRKENESKEGPP